MIERNEKKNTICSKIGFTKDPRAIKTLNELGINFANKIGVCLSFSSTKCNLDSLTNREKEKES